MTESRTCSVLYPIEHRLLWMLLRGRDGGRRVYSWHIPSIHLVLECLFNACVNFISRLYLITGLITNIFLIQNVLQREMSNLTSQLLCQNSNLCLISNHFEAVSSVLPECHFSLQYFYFFSAQTPYGTVFLFIYLFVWLFLCSFFFLCFLPASLRLPKQWQRTQLNDKWHPGQCVCLEWEWGGLITLDTKGFFISQSGRTQCTYLPLGEVGFKVFILMLAKMLV